MYSIRYVHSYHIGITPFTSALFIASYSIYVATRPLCCRRLLKIITKESSFISFYSLVHRIVYWSLTTSNFELISAPMMRTYLSVDRPQYADVNSLPLRHALLQTAAYVISCQKMRGEDASSPRFVVIAYYAAFLDRIPLARRDNSWESRRRDSNSSSSPESSRRRMSS